MAKDNGMGEIIAKLREQEKRLDAELVAYDKTAAEIEKLQAKLRGRAATLRELAGVKSSIAKLSGEVKKRQRRATVETPVVSNGADHGEETAP